MERGEKYLVFCFRSHTSKRLRAIIEERIRRRIRELRSTRLGSEKALEYLKNRLTGRDRDLMPLALDRVLWSAALSDRPTRCRWPIPPAARRLPDPGRAWHPLRCRPDHREARPRVPSSCARARHGETAPPEHPQRESLAAAPRSQAHANGWRRRTASGLSRASKTRTKRPSRLKDAVSTTAIRSRSRSPARGKSRRSRAASESERKGRHEAKAGSGLIEGAAVSPNLWLGPEPLRS